MFVFEPFFAGSANGALAARLSHQVLPFLGGAGFEKLLGPGGRFVGQFPVLHEPIEVGEALGVPRGDSGGLHKLAEVLIASAAEADIPAVFALENSAP